MKLCLKAQTLINKTEVIMTFLDSFKTCLKKTLTISGRASRSEFWGFQLADILGVFVLSMLIGIASQINETLGLLFGFFAGIALLIAGIALFTATIRRFHDIDKSGWFVLLFWLLSCIPFVGFIAMIFCIVFLCKKGTEGDNRFGAQPE